MRYSGLKIILTALILASSSSCTMRGPLTTVTMKDGKTTVEKGFLFKKKNKQPESKSDIGETVR